MEGAFLQLLNVESIRSIRKMNNNSVHRHAPSQISDGKNSEKSSQ